VTEELCPTCRRPLPPDAPGGLCPVCVLLGARGDSVPTDLPPIDEIRAALPQFEILECIGRGGMGVVYKARQPQLDRLVALKILLPGLEHDPGFAERFSREARALAKLSHPNIVAVHDFGESGGYFWLTMEYVDGVNLRQAMQAARFTPAQALALIPELCAALQYAHDHGVLHRDIKPENILLDPKGRVKVADFGIARMAGEERMEFTLTRTGSVLGSAAYVAPEQIERPHEVDHRADLYSLGVVLYEMLTGELPLGRFPAPSEKSASDPRLDEVVFRTLEKEREKRFQSADELKSGVRDFDREAGAGEAAQESASSTLARGESADGRENRKILASAVMAAGFTGMGLLVGFPVISELKNLNGNEYEFLPPGAILSIVAGVLALLFTAAGVILGILSVVKIRESVGKLRGATAAWLAIGAPLLVALGPFVKFVIMALVVIGLPTLAVWAVRKIRRGWRSSVDLPPAKATDSLRPVDQVLPAAPMAGLLPLTFGLLLAGGTLLGIAAAAESILIAAPGACAMVLGFAAGWWALWRMKTGVMPLTGRVLLLVLLVWLPLLGGSATLAILIADDFAPWFGSKGDFLTKMAFVFMATFLPAAGLLRFAALKTGHTRQRRTTVLVAIVLAVAALAGGKCLDGRWPVANYRGTIHMKSGRPELSKRQAAEIEQALRTAAGPHADRMEIAAGEDPLSRRPALRISFIAADEDRWNSHWLAMVKRLSSILPADSYIALDWQSLSMSHDWRRLRKEPTLRHFLISSCILTATALSALLAASVPLSRWWSPVPIFLGGVGVLLLFPTLAKDPLVDGDLLPPLLAAVVPADFSTPETAARSVLDAAHAGDLETVKRGMSRRNRTFLDKRDGWEIAMENLGRRAVVGLLSRGANDPNRSTVERKMRNSSGTLDMLFEDGEWRLDELPFDVPEKP
jgi:serine/threonine protein kinase